MSAPQDRELTDRALAVAQALRAAGLRLATAESCTGGYIAKTLTDLPGSSEWFEAGVVSYSNLAKSALLGVELETLDASGAVSEDTVRAMAEGVVERCDADLGIAVSGVAGPGGGSEDKPVGTVWIAWSVAGTTSAHRFRFPGDRDAVRRATVAAALDGLLQRL